MAPENSKSTPPRETDLPDFYLGRLIWFDEFGDDNCRWVIYDGIHTIRFPSRAAAERYCIEVSLHITEDVQQNLMRCFEQLRRTYTILDKAAEMSPINQRIIIEGVALRVRLEADALDRLIAQTIKPL